MLKAIMNVSLCLGLLVFFVGCSPSNPQGRKAIEGTITLDGKALETGTINFEPLGGSEVRTACGAAIRDGKYSIPVEKGLAPGDYGVSISSRKTSGEPAPGASPTSAVIKVEELVPAEYNTASKQKITVTSDKVQTFDFNM